MFKFLMINCHLGLVIGHFYADAVAFLPALRLITSPA